ncbi:hypothetical protein [Microbispora sp. GKU 823]|uniref:hypothetical protein n=1 Tax=Microbispora sp. GKU 823 TaxID=1652100 RepID=UPI001180E264|nr:hypothetical protein [Microbispora sp. GKU 823]
MADRTVVVKLTLDNRKFIAGLAKAEVAAKKFRDSLEGLSDPFKDMPKEFPLPRMPKELPLPKIPKDRLPKEGDEAAGAFARSFSKRLETAFKALPKAQITASSTDAEAKVQTLRAALADLSTKTVGVDIDADTALGELAAIRAELESIDASADIDLRADTSAAISQIAALQAEVDRFNTDQAERELDDLRARLDALRGRTIGVDLDAGAAKAELADIQRQLEALNRSSANPQVRVDSASALAELRAVQAELSSTDGRAAMPRVDADVSGALRNIALVGAALASLPAVTSVAVGVGALGAAFGAAGAGAAGFAAVAIPAVGRVNEALKEQASAAGSAGAAGESLAQKQAKAASTALQMAQAQDRVRDAHAAVRQAQEQVTIAVEQAAERQASATRRVQDAEYAVADAHRATQRALEDLSRAREDAREKLEDLALATERGALSEERAQLNIIRAQQDLAKANADPKSSALDRQDAALRVREAELALKEIKERNGDLAKEQAKANAQGIEGSDEVRRAKEGVENATRREQGAERDLGDARAAAARAAVEGQRSIAKAQAGVLRAQRDAQRAAEQLRVQQLQAKAALEGAGGAAGGAASKMSKLSKAERELADDIKDYKDGYEDWQRSLEGDVFPAISAGLDLVSSQLPRISPLVRTAGRSFLDLEKDAKGALEDPFWGQFLFNLETAMPGAIESLGHTAGNVFKGLAGVVDAFLPHTDAVTGSIEDASKAFADWGTNLKSNPAFQEFIAYAQANAPKVLEILGNIGRTVGNILGAGSGAGSTTLDILVEISDKLAGMSPDQIQAIALGVGAVMAAAKLGTTIKLGGFLLLANVLSEMSPGQIQAVALAISGVIVAVKGYQTVTGITEWWGNLRGGIKGAGDAAGGAKGKFGGLKDALTGGGGMALAITGVVTAAGALDRELSGLNPNMDNLARHLGDFAKGGKPAADVLDQLGGSVSLIDGRGLQDISDVIERMSSSNWIDQLDTKMGGLANTIGGVVGVSFDHGAERVSNLDQALSTMVTSGNGAGAAKLFDAITKQASDAGVPVAKLRDLFPQYTSVVSGAVQPTNDAAGAISDADKALRDFQTNMDTFAARTDIQAALQGLKKSYDDAKTAIEQAGGKLDFTRQMTDKQRDAVILAREKFSGYINDIQTVANRQAELGAKTGDAAKGITDQKVTILKALPQLFELAGKSKDAREAIYNLGKSAGLSKDQINNAKDSVAKLRLEISRLQNKTITITMVTKGDNSKSIGAGKALHEAGAIERYATGGLRSTPPGVASRPTILYGEGRAPEAFIPYEQRYRGRAQKLLSQVASDFGMRVTPAAGPASSSASSQVTVTTTSTSGAGELRITLDNLEPLTRATDNLGQTAARGVTDAAGQTASAADQVSSAVETAGGDLAASIDRLAASVDALAASVGQAAAAGSSAAGKSSAGKSSNTPGLVAPSGPSAKSSSSKPKSGTGTASGELKAMGSASGGLKQMTSAKPVVITPMANGGLARGPVLAGEAGPEVIIPVSPGKYGRGLVTLHQARACSGKPSHRAGRRWRPATPQAVRRGSPKRSASCGRRSLRWRSLLRPRASATPRKGGRLRCR